MRSVLLQLARDSIQEVLEAQRTIDKKALIEQHPLLNEKIRTTVNIYIENELKGTSSSTVEASSLIDEIIRHAKKSAFENKDFKPLTASEYLSCEIELLLKTPDGVISERDPSILSTHIS